MIKHGRCGMQKQLKNWLERCNIFLDEKYLKVLDQNPQFVECFEKNGISYFVPNSNVASYLNTKMIFHLLKVKDFDLDSLLRLLDHSMHSRVYIFSLFVKHKIYHGIPMIELLSGSLNVQHYRIWRYFFSSYFYSQNHAHDELLIRFVMYCIDYSFYFSHHFEINIILTLIFELVIFMKNNHLDIENMWNTFKAENIFESFEKALYSLATYLINIKNATKTKVIQFLCQKFHMTFSGNAEESFQQLLYELNLWGGIVPKCQTKPKQTLKSQFIHHYYQESKDCILY